MLWLPSTSGFCHDTWTGLERKGEEEEGRAALVEGRHYDDRYKV